MAAYSVVNGWYSTCLDWVEERHALSPHCISMQIVLGRTLFQLRPNLTVETRGKATGARSRQRGKKITKTTDLAILRWETVWQSWACCWWAADLCSFSEITDVLVSSRLPCSFVLTLSLYVDSWKVYKNELWSSDDDSVNFFNEATAGGASKQSYLNFFS